MGIEIDGDVDSAEGKNNMYLFSSLFYLISGANINISIIHCLEEELSHFFPEFLQISLCVLRYSARMSYFYVWYAFKNILVCQLLLRGQ